MTTRKWLARLTAAAVGVVVGMPMMPVDAVPDSQSSTGGGNQPVRSCASLTSLQYPNTVINSATVNSTGTATGFFGPVTGLPEYCEVDLTVTHPPTGDAVHIEVWLPTTTWNGRFQGTGGGAWSGGFFANNLGPAIKLGYAAASTDTGHSNPDYAAPPTWFLEPNGQQLLKDFAHQGIHDMTVAGQNFTKAYYGKNSIKSYFNGCSTGGRQGMAEVQRYPNDYDGVYAADPVVNWTKVHPAQIYTQLKMKELNNFMPQCKFDAVTAAAVTYCDSPSYAKWDGVTDGVLEDPSKCNYDPGAFVGTSTPCGTFTQVDATVVRSLWEGPANDPRYGPRKSNGQQMWFGLARGAGSHTLANTVQQPDGTLTGVPFFVTEDWFKYFLKKDPNFDWKTLTQAQLDQLFNQSVAEFPVIATDNPDLRPFKNSNGKLMIRMSWWDDGVFPGGQIDYWNRVQQKSGNTSSFARMFTAPGAWHCAQGTGGPGPLPIDPLGALVKWVEQGQAPDRLEAAKYNADGGVLRTRPLCPYPKVAKYDGTGSTDETTNFNCVFPNS